jgi:hypothetical protein
MAAELPASVLADLTGISIGTAERWFQWAKRDWAALRCRTHRQQLEQGTAAEQLPFILPVTTSGSMFI